MALEVTPTEHRQTARETHVISVRDVADDLYRAMKVDAAAKGMGFRDYCVSIFEAHIRQQAQSGGVTLIFAGASAPAATTAP
jgi:hypothetical protein